MACWIECLRISNHGLHPIEATLAFRFDADFADVFEVRGTRRRRAAGAYPTSPGRSGAQLSRPRRRASVERASDAREPPDRIEEASLRSSSRSSRMPGQIEIDITCELRHEALRFAGSAMPSRSSTSRWRAPKSARA